MRLPRALLLPLLLPPALIVSGPSLAQEAEALVDVEILVAGERMKVGWKSVSAEIPFGDLNLGSDKGAATLNRRVDAEVRNLCRAASTLRERSRCEATVLASARPQVARLVAEARGEGVAPAPDPR
ncbi:UrcA family protein [Thermaurantiacus sp.]